MISQIILEKYGNTFLPRYFVETSRKVKIPKDQIFLFVSRMNVIRMGKRVVKPERDKLEFA